jgi:hypothetical protein
MAKRNGQSIPRRKQAAATQQQFSIGKYSAVGVDGKVSDPIRESAMSPSPLEAKVRMANKMSGMTKTAEYWAGDAMGGANIADSQNIGYYSFEFPVDALELPQSRAQELRFYRLAYDRDPIVGRGVDLHTEIPMSKVTLERPKCSSEPFADFVYDFYQGLVTNTRMFQMLLDAAREYWYIGEAFLFVEDDPEIEACKAATEFVQAFEEQDSQKMAEEGGSRSYFESNNTSWGSEALGMKSSALKQSSVKLASKLGFNPLANIDKLMLQKIGHLSSVLEQLDYLKTARIVTRKTADPDTGAGSEPADNSASTGGTELPPPGEGGDEMGGGGIVPEAEGGDMGGPSGGGGMGSGGFDFGGGMGMDDTGTGMDEMEVPKDPEQIKLEKTIQLLQKKKELLEELEQLHEVRKNDYELFSHLTNKNYMGFDRIQLLPPENVEIKKSSTFGSEPTIYYKPPEDSKQAYIDNPDTPDDVRDSLSQDGIIPLNDNPFKGSYAIHFARKKAPFEDHGRSILQRCMRTIIYREKLRQVQTTLASRNMTPKTLVVAPNVSNGELMALRGHIDEAKSDPDYTVVVNYECTWNEIGSEGRLLSLESEWAHTGNDLAIGLGFSPDILNGEGLYSNTRTQLEILSTTYLQFRDLVSYVVQELIFKPIAMKKGFYEIDLYGRPRWLYPSIKFGRMALRNTGETYQMLFDLYQKGSVPVEVLLEILDIDPEVCRKRLEEDLFTVNDSKFNAFLENLYSNVAGDERFMKSTDLMDRIKKTLGLKEKDIEDAEIEGSGEGL